MYPVCLPQNDFPLDSDVRHAYEQCLTFEQDAQLAPEGTVMPKCHATPIVVARLLGHALRLAPTQAGRIILAREIIMCNEDQNLLDGLASLYMFGLFRVFRNPKSGIPNLPLDWNPDPSFQQARQETSHLLQASSISTQRMRLERLARDNNRCVFTDLVHIPQAAKMVSGPQIYMAPLQAAHIISQSLSKAKRQRQREWARTAAVMVERFGNINCDVLLRDEVLNSPLNAFMASQIVHDAFDKLDMWLVPVDEDNGYQACHCWGDFGLVGLRVKERIEFEAAYVDNKLISPPHPSLIALHAACAQIAHMSGATEYLDDLDDDSDSDDELDVPILDIMLPKVEAPYPYKSLGSTSLNSHTLPSLVL